MIIIGYILFIGGFLAGALTAVLDETKVNWIYFVLCGAVCGLGVVLIRIAQHGKRHNDQAVEGNLQSAIDAINKIAGNMAILKTETATVSPYEIHARIDELFNQDIELFVEARKSIAHKYGLQSYAEVMNHFAAAERYLNRVWSASVDGYIDEVRTFAGKSKIQFEETAKILGALKS